MTLWKLYYALVFLYIDDDECNNSKIIRYCSPNRCVNTEGSFSCECKEGFKEERRFGNLLICDGTYVHIHTCQISTLEL